NRSGTALRRPSSCVRFRCPWSHLLPHAIFQSMALGSPARALEVASSPTRRQPGMIGKRERIAAMEVLCTNGVKSVMLDLIPEFERTSGTKIVITWGSTNGLLKDLEGGAGADLALLHAEAIDD